MSCQLAPSLPPGVAGTCGLACTNSGGPRPHRIPRPAAATPSGGSGNECDGRSRRWRCPGRGCIGSATASPHPSRSHRFRRRAQRATSRCRSVRPAPCAEHHAAHPEPRDHPVVGRGRSIPDIAATLGVTPAAVRRAQNQALSTLPPAATSNSPPPAGGAPAPRSTPSDNRRAGSSPVAKVPDLPTTGDLAESGP